MARKLVTREQHEYILREMAKPADKRPSGRAIAKALGLDAESVRKWAQRPLGATDVKPLEADAAPEPLTENEQIIHLRKTVQEQQAKILQLSQVIGEQREISEEVKAAIQASTPYKQVDYRTPAKAGSPVIPVLKLSDWHIGEVINEEETERFGRFNMAIAEKRMLHITDKFISWVELMRNAYKIDECRIWREGDMISGNIHKELEITNEFPAPVAAAKSGFLLAEVVSRVAAHFSHVIVEGVDSDNHGRMNPKPQAKQKSENNWSYVVAIIAQEKLKKHGNVDFRWTKGMKYLAEVAGKKFLIEHGDTVKSWMGIPYYGLERGRAREATRRMNTDRTFHYQSIGHWHVPAFVAGNIIVNGSLSGTSEYDHSCGRDAVPSQVAFMVHPKYGVFSWQPFVADV